PCCRLFARLDGLSFLTSGPANLRDLHSFPTRRSSDLSALVVEQAAHDSGRRADLALDRAARARGAAVSVFLDVRGRVRDDVDLRSEEHTSELQSRENLVCRLLLEKKKQPS